MPDLQKRAYEENPHRFAPAATDETVVFGACAPGWHSAASHDRAIDDWIDYMRGQDIQRVLCLVPGQELDELDGNVNRYRQAFGESKVRHAPIPDGQLADRSTLQEDVLPFFDAAADANERVVAHCLAGIGRTGQVLAAWLVHDRSYTPARAIRTVKNMGRLPDEAVRPGKADRDDLVELLRQFR